MWLMYSHNDLKSIGKKNRGQENIRGQKKFLFHFKKAPKESVARQSCGPTFPFCWGVFKNCPFNINRGSLWGVWYIYIFGEYSVYTHAYISMFVGKGHQWQGYCSQFHLGFKYWYDSTLAYCPWRPINVPNTHPENVYKICVQNHVEVDSQEVKGRWCSHGW